MTGLTTITFATLHERNQTALDKRNAESDLSGLSAGKRATVLRLISERAHVCDLQTTQDQREQYGIDRWHREFVRLRDLHRHSDSPLEGAALRAHLWAAIPNSRFKRFQQLFAHPHQYIVPRFSLQPNGKVVFLDNPDFNRISLRPCLVAADRIPEKLAADLGLADFSAERGRPLRRLEHKTQPEVILGLKKIWECARPLQAGHHRVLTIMPPSAEVRAEYPGVAGPHPGLYGTILYTREDTRSADGRGLLASHFPSLYAAQRKTFHEARGYLKEIRELTEMRDDLETFNVRLDTEWRAGAPEETKAALRSEANRLIGRFTEQLAACENRYKLRVRDLLMGIVNMTDCSGKTNVSACMSKNRRGGEQCAETLQRNVSEGRI